MLSTIYNHIPYSVYTHTCSIHSSKGTQKECLEFMHIIYIILSIMLLYSINVCNTVVFDLNGQQCTWSMHYGKIPRYDYD